MLKLMLQLPGDTEPKEYRIVFKHYLGKDLELCHEVLRHDRVHGVTECHIYRTPVMGQDNPGSITSIDGRAWCYYKDAYNHDSGRKIALARALKAARLDKDQRSQVWDAYWYTRNLYDRLTEQGKEWLPDKIEGDAIKQNDRLQTIITSIAFGSDGTDTDEGAA